MNLFFTEEIAFGYKYSKFLRNENELLITYDEKCLDKKKNKKEKTKGYGVSMIIAQKINFFIF